MLPLPRTSPFAPYPGRRTALGLLILPLALWLAASATGARAQARTVLVTQVDGVITPVIADHIGEGVARAEEEAQHTFLIELDTLGGLDASMRDIIQAFLGADVPVVVYVAPSRARAASAGALITMSAHIGAMAPGTAIGAATPVDLEGGDVERKIIEDAAAYAESVARARGRNTEFAVEAVRQGRSVTAEEAERIGVVDLLASNRVELLEAIDGETVTLATGAQVTLETRGAQIVPEGFEKPELGPRPGSFARWDAQTLLFVRRLRYRPFSGEEAMPWWRRSWALAQPNVEADWLSSGAWRSWEPPLNIVRGESHRQQALLEVAGPPRVSGYLLPVEVTFCREPHNPHDRNAFRAEVAGQHIGYLARELAAVAAKPLDRARCERFSVAGVCAGDPRAPPHSVSMFGSAGGYPRVQGYRSSVANSSRSNGRPQKRRESIRPRFGTRR